MPVPWMDLDEQCLEIMCLPFLQDKYELKSCWSTKCWWKHHQSDQVVVDEMIKAWLCLSLSPQTNHRYTRVTQVFTSFVYFLKIFASRSFFEMISIQYLWKVPLQFWVYFDCNDTFRSPEEFKAIGWDYLDLYHYHRMRQKQRRGVLWIKALIWHKLQLSVYKWSSGTGTNIVDISHNRHNQRWCTFSCMDFGAWLFWCIFTHFFWRAFTVQWCTKIDKNQVWAQTPFLSQIERVEPKKRKRLVFHRVFVIGCHIEHAR